MNAIVFKVNRKSGDYIKAALVPANHSEEPHFGLADGVIIAFFLAAATAGLARLATSAAARTVYSFFSR